MAAHGAGAGNAIIVTLNDGKNTKIAASMNGMPHAGVDSKPADITVTGKAAGMAQE